MADTSARLVPNCKVLIDGSPIDPPVQACLVRLSVDLDADLFAQTTMLFSDPLMKLIGGKTFACGAAVKIKLGYGANLEQIFDGEVVRLEPQFRKDEPISLAIVCQEPLHRLALSQSTRSLNDVDVSEIVKSIAQEHGFSSDAPSGTKQHILQGNISNATMLRRVGSRLGLRVRVEGKKLIMQPPASTQSIPLLMKDGISKVKVKVKSGGQVSAIEVHGWDAKNKREVVGSAKPQGEVGAGSKAHGDDAVIADSSGDNLPPDQATAEAMAKGRAQKMAEGFIKSHTEMIGDARMVPGQTFDFDKMGPGIDGTWRIEHALHDFSRRGYFVRMDAVRISAKKPAPPAPPVTTTKPVAAKDAMLIRPRWKRRDNGQKDVADMAVDASKSLEGKSVKFLLETKVDGAWKQVATGQGTVSSGTAITTADLDKLDTADFSNPKWTTAKNSKQTHGDSGEASLTAKAKEGIEVRVILETQVGKGWERLAQKISSVKSGEVKATFTLDHPHFNEAANPASKLLKIPSWTTHPQVHKGSGALQIRAPGLLDGRTVQFDVERKGSDGKWTLVRSAQGKVDRGTAAVSLPDMRHPAHAPAPPHADVLKNPLWGKTDISHGDAGKFTVSAPNLDGRNVAFIVERKDDKGWTQLVKAMAKIEGGKAETSASFAHPTAFTHKPTPPAVKPELKNPRWDKTKVVHGTEINAIVDAVALEGATVEFVAERKEVSGWVEIGRGEGKVSGKAARATIAVAHPMHDQLPAKPDDKNKVKPKLSNPRWSGQKLAAGNQAEAMIDAVGLEGATIQFIAERLESGGWIEVGRATGKVQAKKATGKITIQHPGTDVSLRKLRFRSTILENPNDKLQLPLEAKYDAKTGEATATLVGDHIGRQVRFFLEKHSSMGWKKLSSAVARVTANSKGVVTAKLPVDPKAQAHAAGKLSKPRWASKTLSHGDVASMIVDAAGLDGHTVKFVVQRIDRGVWTSVGTATAKVIKGQAQGSVTVANPRGVQTHPLDLSLSKLRFAVTLAAPVELRVRAEMIPDLDPRPIRFRAKVKDDPNDKVEIPVKLDPLTGKCTTKVAGTLNNRMVKFIFEEKKTAGWSTIATKMGRVVKGAVEVVMPVHHKAAAKLAKPRWGKTELMHGDMAQVVVDAKALDGHRVKFVIEQLTQGKWIEAGNTIAKVAKGLAVGNITVRHPKGEQLALNKLRFRAALADQTETRVRAELLPDIDPKRLRFRAELQPDYTKQKVRFVSKPVPDLLPKRLRFRGELPVPQDPALTRLTCSVVGGGADDVHTGGPNPS